MLIRASRGYAYYHERFKRLEKSHNFSWLRSNHHTPLPRNTHPTGFAHKNSASEKNLTCKKISLRKKKATLLVCVELNASAQGCPQWVILFLRCYFMRGKFFIQ